MPSSTRQGIPNPPSPGLDRLTINKDEFPEKSPARSIFRSCPKAMRREKFGELDLYGQYGITAPFIWKAGRFISRPESSETIDTTTSLFLFGRVDTLRRAVHEELEVDKEQIGHAVIAGFGDVGSAAYTEMVASGISCVVVDAKKYDVNEVVGNAEDEGVLREARIEKPGSASSHLTTMTSIFSPR